jgi:transcriptional regulator with XRE-family HTH domain
MGELPCRMTPFPCMVAAMRTGKGTDLRAVVAANLRRLRQHHGLSQGRLADALRDAEALDWTQATVADVELGQRHLRLEELLALGAFFRVGPEALLAPRRGTVRLSEGISADADAITGYLTAGRGLRRAAYVLLPEGRGIERFTGARIHAPITRETQKEEAEWRALGGDVAELRAQRDLLWRGKTTPQRYAAWRRHKADRLRASRTRETRSNRTTRD